MTSALRNTITELASSFASGVLNAIRGASLEEILAETNGGGAAGFKPRRGPGRPRSTPVVEAVSPRKSGRGRGGRLGRRSVDDIADLVDKIVSLLESKPEGMRAEEIREQLGLEAKELPRPIAEALSAKRIGKQGQKRATTYFARGAGGKGGGARGGAKRGAKKGARGGKRGRRSSEKSHDQGASGGGASGEE